MALAADHRPRRACDGCAPASRPSPTATGSPTACSSAADPSAAPATGSRSRVHRRLRSALRRPPRFEADRHAGGGGSTAKPAPIPLRHVLGKRSPFRSAGRRCSATRTIAAPESAFKMEGITSDSADSTAFRRVLRRYPPPSTWRRAQPQSRPMSSSGSPACRHRSGRCIRDGR